MFVSHQWLSNGNPDPAFEQLQVLQTAMRDLLSGAIQVSLAPADELIWGRVKCPKATDFQDLFLWYDYFCIPQSELSLGHRQRAIDSIPPSDLSFPCFARFLLRIGKVVGLRLQSCMQSHVAHWHCIAMFRRIGSVNSGRPPGSGSCAGHR